MQISEYEKRRIVIGEQMREIEDKLFLLSARSGESNPDKGHRFARLCGERTHLVAELLLNQHR